MICMDNRILLFLLYSYLYIVIVDFGMNRLTINSLNLNDFCEWIMSVGEWINNYINE